MRNRAFLLSAFLLLVPAAQADASGHSAFEGGILDPVTSTLVPISVVLGCDLVVATAGGTATVRMTELPDWLSADAPAVTVDPLECVDSQMESLVRPVNVTVTPAANAPGFVPASLNATIEFVGKVQPNGPATSAVDVAPAMIGYRPGHSLTPAGNQTFQVDGTEFTFEMEIAITANARTMVMFEEIKVSKPSALIRGLRAETYDVAADQRGETRNVIFTAPDGAWDQVEVTFLNFSHCLDGEDCGNQLEKQVKWTFVNAGATKAAAEPPANAGDKDAPAPAPILILAGIIGLAIVLRRRA